jgi:Protein of unknown function (DUF2442)
MELAVKKIRFDEQKIFVLLSDERVVDMPLSWFPRLLKAPKELREKYELWRNGKWIHWEELDEDLSVDGFLGSLHPPR